MYNSKIKDIKQRTFQFSLDVINFVEKIKKDNTVYIIINQLLRCSTSIGANIIEAKSASSRKDFINYYQIALKSANETKYWLLLLKSTNKVNDKQVDILLNELDEICRIIVKSLLTLKGK